MAWYELTLQMDEGTWLVTSPQFPELATFGETQDAAYRHGLDAIEEAIAARIADGEDIPLPLAEAGKGFVVELPGIVYLKSALYMIMREAGMSRADLMRKLDWHREQVDRLFRLDHNSKLDALEQAFKAVGTPLRYDVPFPAAA